MSSISGVGANVDLFNILGQSTTNTSTVGSSLTLPPPPADETGDSSETDSAEGTEGHHHHGHHGVQGQIENAVTSALQNSTPGQDPNQLVQNAIASVLQQGQQGASASGTTGQNGGTSDGTDSADGTNGSGQLSQSQFEQLLQSNGISPQQFQSDLKAAFSDDGSGGQSVNFSTLFQSFPPGSAVDTTA